MEYHNAVLLKETVDGLHVKPDGVYVDVTFGGGGHSREILTRLGPRGKLYAFDQDKDALANTIDDDRFVLINENFRFIKRFLRFYGVKKVIDDVSIQINQKSVTAFIGPSGCGKSTFLRLINRMNDYIDTFRKDRQLFLNVFSDILQKRQTDIMNFMIID